MKKLLFVLPVVFIIFGCSAKINKDLSEPATKEIKPNIKQTNFSKNSATALYIDGLIQSIKGNSAEAILNFQEALQFSPQAGIYYSIAKDFLRMNKINQAIQNINKAIEIDSSKVDYYLFLGQIYTMTRKNEYAIETLEKVLQMDSSNYQALFSLGELYEPSKPKKALDIYNKVLTIIGPEWNVLVKIADLNERLGNVDNTISTVEELVKLNPTNLELKKLLIEAYIKNKNYERAVALIDETLELFPNDLNLIEYKANSLVHLGKWEEGAKSYTLLLKSDEITFEGKLGIVSGFMNETYKDSSLTGLSKNMLLLLDADTLHWQVKVLLGEAYVTEKEIPKAIECFIKSAELAPWNEQVVIRLGGFLFDQKEYKTAITEMEKALVNFPENFLVNLILAYSHSQLQEHLKARTYFAKAHELNSSDISVLSAYGYTLHQLGESDEALVYLNKAITLDENNAQVYGMMGMIYDKKEMWAQCDSAYEKAIILDTNDVLLLNNYAYSLSERGLQLDRCLAMAQKAINKEPKNSSYLDTIGWIYFKLNNFDKAKDYILQSLEVEPTNAVVVEHLGDVYFKLGQTDKAIDSWKKAFQIDGSLIKVKEKIEKGGL